MDDLFFRGLKILNFESCNLFRVLRQASLGGRVVIYQLPVLICRHMPPLMNIFLSCSKWAALQLASIVICVYI